MPLINNIMRITEQKVLVAPLAWGLGHATRCVPVIKALQQAGKKVVIAADGYPLLFLKKEFPTLQIIKFKGLNIKYSPSNSQVWAILKQIPHIVFSIIKEHKELKRIVKLYDIKCVISDNRFGLFCKKTKNIYITHQIGVKIGKNMRILNNFAYRLHKFIINRYDECWVPDLAEADNLSGELSHKYPLPKNARFIGVLSRFETKKQEQRTENKEQIYKNVAVISGVEPHRTLLQQKLLNFFLSKGEKSLIIAGKPAEMLDIENINNVAIVSHLEDRELAETLTNAENIYCRSGYSTLMDLHALGIKSATLIPTPGQTEQEYIAEYFLQKGFYMAKQDEFIIEPQKAVGKIAVVTGANGGFGFFIAKNLAKYGAKVVFACRNEQKAKAAIQKILAELPQAKLDFLPLDLSDLQSVKNFAETYRQTYETIDILINNAGILFVPHKTTKDGFEQIFQTNYLGHFLLTNLILPLFSDSYTSKIITQSSVMYKTGNIHFYDLNLTKHYSKWTAYAQSKLALTLFAIELQRKLTAQGSKIQSIAAHPGISVETNILTSSIIKKVAKGFCSFFAQSAEKGAMPAVVAAVSDEIKGGDFVGLDGFIQGKGNPVKIVVSQKALDGKTAKKIWEASEKFVATYLCESEVEKISK